MRKTETILKERGKQHGPFNSHAEIEQRLRDLQAEMCLENITPVQEIGLGMIMHKIARILNGGYGHQDTWEDIAGYATLVAKDMEEYE